MAAAVAKCSADHGVGAAEADVFGGHALVDGGALLEEKHPGSDGGADIGEDDQENVFVEAGERLPGDECAAHRVPTGVGHERDGNEDQIECGGGESDALPGPIAVTHQGGVEDDERDEDCDPGTDSEETEAGADGDELGDEREEVADAEVDHGEPSPERTEAVEDEFGVAAMGSGAEADGHFLDDDGHAEGEGDEGEEKTDAELGAGSGVGEHAGAVVLSEHDEDAGADEQPQETGIGGKAAPGAGGRDTDAIVGAIDIFVGDYYDFVSVLGGERLHRLERLQCAGNLRRFGSAGTTPAEISASIHEEINYS